MFIRGKRALLLGFHAAFRNYVICSQKVRSLLFSGYRFKPLRIGCIRVNPRKSAAEKDRSLLLGDPALWY